MDVAPDDIRPEALSRNLACEKLLSGAPASKRERIRVDRALKQGTITTQVHRERERAQRRNDAFPGKKKGDKWSFRPKLGTGKPRRTQ